MIDLISTVNGVISVFLIPLIAGALGGSVAALITTERTHKHRLEQERLKDQRELRNARVTRRREAYKKLLLSMRDLMSRVTATSIAMQHAKDAQERMAAIETLKQRGSYEIQEALAEVSLEGNRENLVSLFHSASAEGFQLSADLTMLARFGREPDVPLDRQVETLANMIRELEEEMRKDIAALETPI